MKTIFLAIGVCQKSDVIEKVTSHSIFYDGIATTVTVAHVDCPRSVVEKEFVICDDIDIIMYRECPLVNHVLNISFAAKLREGDNVVAVGYKHFHNASKFRSWEGQIMGMVWEERKGQCLAGSGKVTVKHDEFLLSGKQVQGMSGGACLNGYGYLGAAHAIDQDKAALVIPESYIKEFINKNRKHLKHFTECSNLTIVEPPMYGFTQ